MVNRIVDRPLSSRRMAPTVTWLGQAGFRFDAGGRRVLVDPFFSEHPDRAYPPPPLDVHGVGCDWLLITHEHLDHLDDAALPEIARRSDRLRVAVPAPLEARVRALDASAEVIPVERGDRLELDGVGAVTVVPAVHAVEPEDGYSDDPRFVGYVLELDGVALYHAGDTLVSDGLLEALGDVRVDVALVPINGRNHFRERDGLAGNTDAREAVALARHAGAQILVPIHWDLFAANGERPGAAVDAALESEAPLHVVVLRRGVPWAPAAAR